MIAEKKKPCSPCQENAVLHVGDAICHRIAHHDGSIDCHGLANKVRTKNLTLDEYVQELERRASPQEKMYVEELKKLYG